MANPWQAGQTCRRPARRSRPGSCGVYILVCCIRSGASALLRMLTRPVSSAAGGQGPETDECWETLMEDAQKAGRRGPGSVLLDWPDSGSIAVITWRTASGDVHRQELGSRREAEDLLAKIEASAELSLVSAQARRVGIGPDS